MTFDSHVPNGLKKVQEWFGKIITRRIDGNSQINPISPSGRMMIDEAAEYIAPSPTLQPVQRMQIYNQQYWWRLLRTLHENFPYVTRLFGYRAFNEVIGFPYLEKYLSNHWSLNYLGDRLLLWLEEEYHACNKPLVRDAIHIDWIYQQSLFAVRYDPLKEGESDYAELMTKKIFHQPHMHVLTYPYDLFRYRREFLSQEVDYWMTHNFPEMLTEKIYYFVLYREMHNHLMYEEISLGEYYVLQRFQSGETLEKAIEWLERQNQDIVEEAASHLHLWVQKWIAKQWVYLQHDYLP